MIDPYYRVRSDIHRKRPAYGMLMVIWNAIMVAVSAIFGWYWFNMEVDISCYVKKGEMKPLGHTELLQPTAQSEFVNVAL